MFALRAAPMKNPEGLCRWLVTKLGVPQHLREDALQEATLAFHEAKARFDPSRGAQLGTFVHWRIEGAVKSFLWNCARHGVQDIDEEKMHAIPVDPVDVDSRMDCERLLSRISDEDREILRSYYFGGEKFHQIAARLGISKSWMSRRFHQALQRARGLKPVRRRTRFARQRSMPDAFLRRVMAQREQEQDAEIRRVLPVDMEREPGCWRPKKPRPAPAADIVVEPAQLSRFETKRERWLLEAILEQDARLSAPAAPLVEMAAVEQPEPPPAEPEHAVQYEPPAEAGTGEVDVPKSEETRTCSAIGCSTPLRRHNKSGVCTACKIGKRTPRKAREEETEESEDLEVAERSAEEELAAFRAVASALGRDPDHVLATFAREWLERVKGAVAEL